MSAVAEPTEQLNLIAAGTSLSVVDADEIEAEKVWTLAGVIRAANTAWGVDEGLDADVREARALMAEARRQVRENAPVGTHYRADGPDIRSVA